MQCLTVTGAVALSQIHEEALRNAVWVKSLQVTGFARCNTAVKPSAVGFRPTASWTASAEGWKWAARALSCSVPTCSAVPSTVTAADSHAEGNDSTVLKVTLEYKRNTAENPPA